MDIMAVFMDFQKIGGDRKRISCQCFETICRKRKTKKSTQVYVTGDLEVDVSVLNIASYSIFYIILYNYLFNSNQRTICDSIDLSTVRFLPLNIPYL